MRVNGRQRPTGLSAAERELWAAFPTGRLVDLRGRSDRRIRGSVLARLLVGGCPTRPGYISAVRVRGAQVVGGLDVTGGRVACEMHLTDCRFDQVPSFANALTRQLRFTGCLLPGFDGGGLRCDGFLSLSGSTFVGQIRLTGATIRGGLRINGARIRVADTWAIFAGGLQVDSGVFVRDSVIAGGLRITGARLNGGLFMEGTHLIGLADRAALDGESMVVSDVADFTRTPSGAPFTCDGQIRLRGARITGSISFRYAVLRSETRLTLLASHLTADRLNLTTDGPVGNGLSLSYARIRVLYDAPDSWPELVFLNGASYDSLRGAPLKDRLNWVERDSEFHLDRYEALSDWYRRNGHDDLARDTQLAKQRARRARQPRLSRVGGLLLDWTIGYGHRPWLAGIWFTLLLTVGTAVFTVMPPHQLKQPQDIPTFHPLIYTLDLLVPIPLFGQRDHFNPVGWTAWFSYVLIVAGWIFATALIAGATRVLRPARSDTS